MADTTSSHPTLRETFTVVVIYFAMAVLFQWFGGVYQSEFGGHPDEAAHYVTGLMIHDYLLSGFHQAPMKYAEDYYKHYPKVGLGNWPPVFYLVQAAWTIPFSPSRLSILHLMAFLAALLATIIFRTLREEYRFAGASIGGILFLALPLAQQLTGMVMAEILTALFMFVAALCFGCFLDTGKGRSAILFGIFTALAILTKGNGMALGLMAVIALAVSGRFSLLKKGSLWVAGILVVILAGPWMWHFRELGKAGWVEPHPSLHFTIQAFPYYLKKFGLAIGPVGGVLMLLGIVARARRPDERRGKWAAMFSLLVAVIVFQWIAPVGFEARHLVPALPPAILFAIAGLEWLIELRVARSVPSAVYYGLALISGAALCVLPPFTLPRKGSDGFEPVVSLLETGAGAQGSLLISSDASGEGMFIADLALADHRPGHVIERASKILASSTWSGGGYQPRFHTEEEMRGYLAGSGMKYVVLDDSIPAAKRVSHHDLLLHALTDDPAGFPLLGTFPIWRGDVRQAEPIRLYQIVGP